MVKRYVLHRPSCTVHVGETVYRHGDDVTEWGPELLDRSAHMVRVIDAPTTTADAPADEEE